MKSRRAQKQRNDARNTQIASRLPSLLRRAESPTTREVLFLLVAATLSVVVYYWPVFSSRFDTLIGDDADARLNLLLADSWRDFFNGSLPFADLRTFYPLQWTRSGTDLNLTLFLLELPFRACGMDFIQSCTAVYLFLHWQCIVCTYIVVRRDLSLPVASACICTVLVSFSNAFHEKLLHTQFFFLLLIPLLFMCVLRYLRLYHRHQKIWRMGYGIAALLVFAAIIYSSYYPAFFACLFGVAFLVCFLVNRQGRKVALWFIRKRAFELILLFVLGIVLLVPFVYAYLPGIGKGWDAKTTLGGLPIFADLIRIGDGNLLWGRMMNGFLFFFGQEGNQGEHTYGLPPLTLMLTLWSFVALIRIHLRKKHRVPPAVTALASSIALLWLVTLRIGDFSPWQIFCHVVPGASAIRSWTRLYVFLTYPAALLCAVMLASRTDASKGWRYAVVALIPLLLLDNLNVTRICRNTRSHMLERIQKVPPPPSDARLFVIMPERGTRPDLKQFPEHPWVEYGLLAMEIAQKYRLYTFNGFTGKVLAEEWLFYQPYMRYYPQYVDEWIESITLAFPVYDYEPALHKWQLHEARHRGR